MPRAPRTGRSPRSLVRLVAALVGALAIHALGGGLLVELGALDGLPSGPRAAVTSLSGGLGAASSAAPEAGAGPAGDDRPIELQALVDELDKPPLASPEEKKREEDKKRADEEKGGTIVSLSRPAIEAAPDRARFRSEFDSRVERETRGARGHDRAGDTVTIEGGEESRLGEERERAAGLPGPRALRRAGGETDPRSTLRQQPGLLGQEGAAESIGPDGDSARPGPPGLPGRPPSARRRAGGPAGSNGDAPIDRLGMGEEGAGGHGEPHLSMTEEMLRRALRTAGGAPDALPDVESGAVTALNAKRYKYAPFFNRMSGAISQEWKAAQEYGKHDPTGNVYGIRDRVTVVEIQMLPDGQVKDVRMLESSGLPFLDDEAVGAVRRAAPFPNPPAQVVDPDGIIRFDVMFILEISGHRSVRRYRYD